MKKSTSGLLLIAVALVIISWNIPDENWIRKQYDGYSLIYTSKEEGNIENYNKLIRKGIDSIQAFFQHTYPKEFSVFIHPNRQSLDSTWQKEWNMPDFKSECWMVASGVAHRLDVISPIAWDEESCEHSYLDAKRTQQLIIHELVHVYHGQKNKSPDFSNVEGIDWFIEGLAVYASGQCDSLRLREVKEAIKGNKLPENLDNFWTGRIKYGLSGSVVLYMDKKYGRTKLLELLPFHTKSEILSALKVTEPELLSNWKNEILNL